jgi:hypothetical protein
MLLDELWDHLISFRNVLWAIRRKNRFFFSENMFFQRPVSGFLYDLLSSTQVSMSFSYTYTPCIINRYGIKTLVYKPSFLESDSTVSFTVISLSLGYFPMLCRYLPCSFPLIKYYSGAQESHPEGKSPFAMKILQMRQVSLIMASSV